MENGNNRNIWIIVGIIVVLLCCCVLAVGALIAALGGGFFATFPAIRQGSIGRVTERTESVFDVGQAATLGVDNFAGNVDIRSGESGRMRVVITKRAISSDNLQRINPDVHQQDGGLIIKVPRPDNIMSNTSVDIQVFVPNDTQLDLSTGAGNVDVQDILGQISANTGAGNVQVRGAQAAVDLNTGAGEVNYEGQPQGACTFHTGAGNVTLHLPADLGASLVLDTGIGNISLGGFNVQGNTRGTHVEGTIGSGNQATIRAGTGVGNVTLIRQ